MSGVLALTLLAAGCSGGDGTDRRLVVATTTVLGDVVSAIAADRVEVEVLLPVGADPHDYRPSSRQVATLLEADLVVANGLGLEEGLEDILQRAVDDGARVVQIAGSLDPIPFGSARSDGLDPHVWLDPVRMARAAHLIGEALTDVYPGEDWAAAAGEYADRLLKTHEEIEGLLAGVAVRKLVTNHGALGYFAARYGFDIVGTIIPGGATLAEPSSADLAALVAIIDREGVAAIFVETTEPSLLAEAIAAETEQEVAVVELYTESVGEAGSGADTLIGMLLVNAERIAGALS